MIYILVASYKSVNIKCAIGVTCEQVVVQCPSLIALQVELVIVHNALTIFISNGSTPLAILVLSSSVVTWVGTLDKLHSGFAQVYIVTPIVSIRTCWVT